MTCSTCKLELFYSTKQEPYLTKIITMSEEWKLTNNFNERLR